MEELVRTKKIRPRQPPYGAPLFFVKERDKPMIGLTEYRTLNRITKCNNANFSMSGEIFDKVFSITDIKTGFY